MVRENPDDISDMVFIHIAVMGIHACDAASKITDADICSVSPSFYAEGR